MRDISSIEIGIIVKELNNFIAGSRIKKIYYLGQDSFSLENSFILSSLYFIISHNA